MTRLSLRTTVVAGAAAAALALGLTGSGYVTGASSASAAAAPASVSLDFATDTEGQYGGYPAVEQELGKVAYSARFDHYNYMGGVTSVLVRMSDYTSASITGSFTFDGSSTTYPVQAQATPIGQVSITTPFNSRRVARVSLQVKTASGEVQKVKLIVTGDDRLSGTSPRSIVKGTVTKAS